jgi:hypothetical protein
MMRRVAVPLAVLVMSGAAVPSPAWAQQATPLVQGLLTGYGSVSYSAEPDNAYANNFSATFSPLLLHQVGSDILFEAEMDLELEEANTSIHLEHAQIHYLGFENLQFTAGMFHIPFGVWTHSTWINRMPTPPLLYQDTHGAPPHEALLPILFDVGVMARATLRLFDGWTTSADLWVTQGPSDEIEVHDHDPAAPVDPAEPHADATPLGYGATFEDNNSDKMVGVRLRAASHGGVTIQGSGFRAKYDHDGDLGVYGFNLSLIWAPRSGGQPLFDVRGEGILLGQEFLDDVENAIATVNSGGYYVQLSKRSGSIEPVVRWSQLPQAIAGEGPLVEGRRQMAVGLNYWLAPSVPLKAAYNIELDGTDALFLEWSVGF